MSNSFDHAYHHLIHYLALMIIVLGGLLILFFVPLPRDVRFLFVIVIGLLYVLWGIGHDFISHKRFHYHVMIEYLLIALIGMAIARGVLGL